MASMQGRLEDLLQQGRRLRQQIESIAGDVDFPLTRDPDGERLRGANPSKPDPPAGRQADRADDRKRKRPSPRS